MGLFGGLFSAQKTPEPKTQATFTRPTNVDGALEIESNGNYIHYDPLVGTSIDLGETIHDDRELILTYRGLASQLIIDEAIIEIVDEAIVNDGGVPPVEIILTGVDVSESIKSKIIDEFDTVLKLMNFAQDGHAIFRKWYIDGRLVYHKVISDKSTDGIQKMIMVDPINIRLVRQYEKTQLSNGETVSGSVELYDTTKTQEYYLFSETGFSGTTETGLKIDKDAIAYVTSGIVSPNGQQVYSHLNKSIRIFNNLRMLEDSLIVLRVSRAPERRIFSVDTGSLQSTKSEQYLKDTMARFKNKVVYDANTGKLANKKNLMAMTEDWWFAKRDGGAGTTVESLPGDQSLGELSDVRYFESKLKKSLYVPIGRGDSESNVFSSGNSSEITREELRFTKFVNKLKAKFGTIFADVLRTQLILKNIITAKDWDDWGADIHFRFATDNYFNELKESEILLNRAGVLSELRDAGVIGKYISNKTIRVDILKQSDKTIEIEDELIASEAKLGQFKSEEEEEEERY